MGRWGKMQKYPAGAHLSSGQVCVRTYGNHQGSISHELGEGVKMKVERPGTRSAQEEPWCGQEGACGPSLRRPLCQQGMSGKGPALGEV